MAAPAIRQTIEAKLPGLLEYLAPRRPNLDAELADLIPPRWQTPPPSAAEQTAGVHLDLYEVDRVLRFCAKLRHVKGRTHAGRPFVPDLWQVVYVIAPLFGWLRPDGLRYYSEAFVEVPRKNGKSTLGAALMLYLLFADREPGAELVGAARKRAQARAIFEVAAKMAKTSPALRQRSRIIDRREHEVIEVLKTGSVWNLLPGQTDKHGDALHGLNLHAYVIDELHVVDDEEYVGTIETSTGSRENPLGLYFTTAGDPDVVLSPWSTRRARIIRASEGTAPAGATYGAIWAAPAGAAKNGRWRNSSTWRKANPGYGTALQPRALERAAAKAENSPAELARFLRLHLGIPQSLVTGWHPLEVWDATAGMVDETELAGRPCWGGLDLSSLVDLSALVLIFPTEDASAVDVVCRFWTPGETMTERGDRDGAPYADWTRDGWLTACNGPTIDYDLIEAEAVEVLSRFDLRGLNYDPWGSKQLADHLYTAGVPLWDMPQTTARFSPAIKEADRLILERRLRHGGHPVLRFCASNLAIYTDHNGNYRPDRKNSKSRIDGAVALFMALEAWLRDLAPASSVYEDRDVQIV